MSEDVVEHLIADYLSYDFPTSVFSWQGGEPTLAGLDFFRLVVDLEKRYGRSGQVVGNALQTNGILIDEDWAQFLAEYKFLVGISLDGPEEVHNYYRQNTWRRVMNTVKILKRQQVAFNILTVVSEANVRKPKEIYRFFRQNDFSYLQFIPCLEWDPERQKSRPYAFEPEEYGEFLCQIFDEWRQNDVGRVSVRMFDDILSYYLGKGAPSCTFADRCNTYMVVEFNGDIYPCDFWVYPQWKLGNLTEQRLADIADSGLRQKFARRKGKLDEQCAHCKWLPLCRGGCQVDRFYPPGNPGVGNNLFNKIKRAFPLKIKTSKSNLPNSNRGNYLCPAYRKFFAFSEQGFQQLARDQNWSSPISLNR